MRKLINISKPIAEGYEKYFLRNCNKWISRNNISEENLGKEFQINEEQYILSGQINDKEYFMTKKSTGEYFKVHGDLFVTDAIKKQNSHLIP